MQSCSWEKVQHALDFIMRLYFSRKLFSNTGREDLPFTAKEATMFTTLVLATVMVTGVALTSSPEDSPYTNKTAIDNIPTQTTIGDFSRTNSPAENIFSDDFGN